MARMAFAGMCILKSTIECTRIATSPTDAPSTKANLLLFFFSPRDLGEKKNSNKFAFVLGASVGLVAILVHSIVDFNMHIPANAILAIALMALLTGHLRFATDRYWISAGRPVKALAGVVM